MKVEYHPKMQCSQCISEALWEYSPRPDSDAYFCDACVPRGCSCNLIFEDPDAEENRDELGRLLPCCEYNYFEEGFDDERKNIVG